MRPKKRKSAVWRVSALALAAVLLFSGCGAGVDVQTQSVGARTEVAAAFAGAGAHGTQAENLVYVTSSGFLELYYDSAAQAAAVRETNTGTYWQALPAVRTDGAEVPAAVLTAEVSLDGTLYSFNSQDNAVAFGTTVFTPTPDGMELTYTMAPDAETAKLEVGAVPAGTPYLRVTVAFVLEDGALRVKVNCGDIALSAGCVLERLTLLDWFGATDSAADGDYMLLPDGSGAVEPMDGVCEDAYPEKTFVVYGADPALAQAGTAADGTLQLAPARIPAYGMRRGQSAFVAVIESGDAIARITSHRAAAAGEYNRVGPTFCITDTALSDETLYTGNAFSGEITVCYRFLSNRNAGYAGMAAACREVLIRNGTLPAQATAVPETLPMVLTVYAAASKSNPNRSVRLTSFAETQELLRLLKAKSVDNVTVRLVGTLDGAASQGLLRSCDFSGKLGNDRELEQLLQFVQAQQFSIYLDIDIASFGRRSVRRSAYAAKGLSGDTLSYAKPNELSLIAGDAQHTRYFLRQTELGDNVEGFVHAFYDDAFSGACVADAGQYLYSDYASAGNTRTVMAGHLREQAATLAASRTLMVDTGNAYLLRDADVVVSLPGTSAYPETDSYRAVPFLQMVLHGIISYALSPANTAEDAQTAFLKALEYGALPSYAWYYEKTGTDADAVYHYEAQINAAAENYKLAASMLGDLQDARMTAHEEVQAGVYRVEYNNSAALYFNYTDAAVTVDSITVEPMSCQRVN